MIDKQSWKSETTTEGSWCDKNVKKQRSIMNVHQKLRMLQDEANKYLPADRHKKLKSLQKPDKQIVYLSKNGIHNKLKLMSNRMDVGKYEMIIEVNIVKGKPKIEKLNKTDEYCDKQYHQIYKQYIKGMEQKNKNHSSLLFNSAILNDSNIQSFKKTAEKIANWKSRMLKASQGSKFNTCSPISHEEIKKLQTQKQKDKVIQDFELLAAQSKMFDNYQSIAPEDVIKERFCRKFFCQRKKKLQQSKEKYTLDCQNSGEYVNVKRSISEDDGMSKFLRKQKRIMNLSIRSGICEESKIKLQDQFNEIAYQMKKPIIKKRKINTSNFSRSKSEFANQ